MKKLLRKSRKAGAFTLIEMVIVLFIIGLLMLLIIPNLNNQKKKAEKKTNNALVTTIQTQVDLYEDEITKPITLDKLKTAGAITEKKVQQANDAHITISSDGKVQMGE